MASTAPGAEIPFGSFYLAVRAAEKRLIVRHAIWNACVLLLAIVIGSWVQPVNEIRDVHNSLLSHFHIFSKRGHGKLIVAGADAMRVLEDVISVEDTWSWLQHVLWPMLFPSRVHAPDNGNAMLLPWYNHPVGLVRLRQVRVLPQQCADFGFAASLAGPCWPDFNEKLQSSILLPDRRSWQTAPSVHDAVQSGLPIISGQDRHSLNYGSRSQVLDVPLGCQSAGNIMEQLAKVGLNCSGLIAELRKLSWIDEGSRMLSTELSIKNANYDLWTYVRFQFDFSAFGHVQSSLHLRSIRLRPNSLAESATACMERIIAEVVFVIVLFISLLVEIHNVWRLGTIRYFTKVCRVLQLVFVVLLALAAFLCCLFLADAADTSSSIETKSGSFNGEKLLDVSRRLEVVMATAGIGVCLGCFLLIDLVRLYEPAHLLLLSFRTVVAQALLCLSLFLLSILACALAGHLALGLQWSAFVSLGSSFRSLLEAMRGDLDLGNVGPGHSAASTQGLRWEAVVGLVTVGMLFAALAAFLSFALLEARRKARRRKQQLTTWLLEQETIGSAAEPVLVDAGLSPNGPAEDNAQWLAAANRFAGEAAGEPP
jgi:hypothetical protein